MQRRALPRARASGAVGERSVSDRTRNAHARRGVGGGGRALTPRARRRPPRHLVARPDLRHRHVAATSRYN